MNRTAFDLTAPLPTGRISIEASAGTGKTYSLTGLVVRYIAESDLSMDQLLVVTFTRAAANDLRDRARSALQVALQATLHGTVPDRHPWMSVLLDTSSGGVDVAQREQRLTNALHRFDELSITTIHGFCQNALSHLGVRAGSDSSSVLVENLNDLVAEVCRDIVVSRLADEPKLLNSPRGSKTQVRNPAQAEAQLIANVNALIANAGADFGPHLPHPVPGSSPFDIANDTMAAHWVKLTREALDAVATRQRYRNEIGYDNLVARLRDALHDPIAGHSVAEQLAQRWSVVLVDEFQDTDRLQWDVFNTAFARRTLITVGDPKQAIYRFRGADVHAYLDAVNGADSAHGAEDPTALALATNHRSDQRLLEGLGKLFEGASLGDPRILFEPVAARQSAPVNALKHRRHCAPTPAVQVRVAPLTDTLRAGQKKDLSMPLVRTLVLADLVQRTIDLLDHGYIELPAGSESDVRSRPVAPGDIAVLVPSHAEANNVAEAMRRARIPAVRTRTGSVLTTPAALQWRMILEAMTQPHRVPTARAAALGWFLPTDVTALTTSDDLLVDLHEHLGQMAHRIRTLGVSAFYDEQKSINAEQTWGIGLLRCVLGREGGERHLTDLDHIAELLAEATQSRPSDPAHVLRTLEGMIAAVDERNESSMRRIDSDSIAVQITTIHSAKGLEYPIVLVPFGFKQRANIRLPHSYRGPDNQRVLDLASTVGWDGGCSTSNDESTRQNQEARRHWSTLDIEGDELRLLYVALTRAAHRVEIWWACTQYANSSALGRLLLDRRGRGPVANTVHGWQHPTNAKGNRASKPVLIKPPYRDLDEQATMAQIRCLADESGGTIGFTELADRIVASIWTGRTNTPPPSLNTATVPHGRSAVDRAWKRWSFSRLGTELDNGPDDLGSEHKSDAASYRHADSGGDDEPADETSGPTDLTELDDLADDVEVVARQLSLWSDVGDGFGQRRLDSAGPGVSTPAARLAGVVGGTRFGTFVHGILEAVDPGSAGLADDIQQLVVAGSQRDGLDIVVDDVVEGILASLRTPLGPLFDDLRLVDIPSTDRLAELTFDLPLLAGAAAGQPLAAWVIGQILLDESPLDDPFRPFARQLAGDMANLQLAGWMHGSIDAVLRVPDPVAQAAGLAHPHRYLVVDYKTNRLHPIEAHNPIDWYGPGELVAAMEHSRYPLQALLYSVAVHRYLRWRLGRTYEPERHLGGTGYLFLRAMVGPDTPRVGGVPNGVCSWRPSISAIVAIDDYFATGSVAGSAARSTHPCDIELESLSSS